MFKKTMTLALALTASVAWGMSLMAEAEQRQKGDSSTPTIPAHLQYFATATYQALTKSQKLS